MVTNRWLALAAAFFCLNASAQTEFLIFPELTVSLSDRTQPDNGQVHTELIPAGDFFLSSHFGRFNLLAEYFLSTNEAELERLQVGWDFSEDLKVRLGRGHNFLGYWNTEFHHGSFLETSINRPAFVEFEDEGGIVPTHISGLTVQVGNAFESGQLRCALAFGLVPKLGDGMMEAFNILDPRPSNHNLGGSLRISFHPEALSPNEIGVFGGVANLDTQGRDLRKVIQQQYGAFLNWEFDNVRIISSVFYIHNRIERASTISHDTLVSGYLQAEYAVNEVWRLYARFEKTGNVDEIERVFPELVNEWALGGVRLDIGSHNALKLELGHKRQVNESNFQVNIEWSAVFP